MMRLLETTTIPRLGQKGRMTIENAINQLRQQNHWIFLLDEKVDLNRVIEIDVENVKLKDLLTMIASQAGYAWDLRYVYYAGLHGKRLVNGYSGYFPAGYRARAARIDAVWSDRAAAWDAIRSSGATHLLVHREAYVAPEGPAIAGWAEQSGARPIAEFADGSAPSPIAVRTAASRSSSPVMSDSATSLRHCVGQTSAHPPHSTHRSPSKTGVTPQSRHRDASRIASAAS